MDELLKVETSQEQPATNSDIPQRVLGAIEYHAEQILVGATKVIPGSPSIDELKNMLQKMNHEMAPGQTTKWIQPEKGTVDAEGPLRSKLEELQSKVDRLQLDESIPEEDKVTAELEEGSPEYLMMLSAQMFNMMDADEIGEIDLSEAAAFVKRAGIIQMSAEEVAAKYDTDHNGKISLQEFTEVVTDLYSSGEAGVEPTDNSHAEEKSERKWWRDPIDPESALGFRCTLITMTFVLYSAFLIPARLGFETEEHAAEVSTFLDFCSELWFLVDIVISFRLGYVDEDTQELVMDFVQIRKKYLYGWFALDFTSGLPVKTITLVYPEMESFGFLKVFRLCKLFRLVKLLKLKALEDLEDSGAVSPTMVRLSKISFIFCFLMHITACMYWGVVRLTCSVCTEETQELFGSDCGSPYTRTSQPAFTTPDFCPSVWRLRGQQEYTGQESPPTISDSYYYSFYWSIMAMLGDNSAPGTNIQFMVSGLQV
jgi:hypothetical protein